MAGRRSRFRWSDISELLSDEVTEEDENRFYVFESYADRAACQVHNCGPILARTLAQGDPMLAGPTVPLGRGSEVYP